MHVFQRSLLTTETQQVIEPNIDSQFPINSHSCEFKSGWFSLTQKKPFTNSFFPSSVKNSTLLFKHNVGIKRTDNLSRVRNWAKGMFCKSGTGILMLIEKSFRGSGVMISSYEYFLLLQRTGLNSQHLLRQFTIACNSNSRGPIPSSSLGTWTHMHLSIHWYTIYK